MFLNHEPFICKEYYNIMRQWRSQRRGQGATARLQKLCPLLPQMKLHFVQRSMESRHCEFQSAPPPLTPEPPCRPLILKILATPLL